MSPKPSPFNRDKLVKAARAVQKQAYAPYSKYKVGAALLTADGKIFTGCNVENASYPAGICAERVAVTKAISEGHRKFVAIAVVTKNGGSPCGICRQVMSEFAPDLQFVLANGSRVVHEFSMDELLPERFGPDKLK